MKDYTKILNFFKIQMVLKHSKDNFEVSLGRLIVFKKEPFYKKNKKVSFFKHDDKYLKIAVAVKGGIGDQLIGCNYVKALADKIKDENISIDCYVKPEIKNLFLQDADFITSVYDVINFNCNDEKYDVYIQLDRFPNILKFNEETIQKHPLLYKYVYLCSNFKKANNNFFTGRSEWDYVLNTYSLILGKKRISQADIDDFLSIDEKFKYTIKVTTSPLLAEYKLKKYITIHRGVDTSRTEHSNKLYPLEYYNTLVNLLKQEYPDYKIVQLGVNRERCPEIAGIDINLVGKTSLSDIISILKESFLHIDGEGGFVHVRHALGISNTVVLFGSTLPQFYGYSENLNLRAPICPFGCEHIRIVWDETCIKNNSFIPLCMQKLEPDYVFSEIKKYLSNRG